MDDTGTHTTPRPGEKGRGEQGSVPVDDEFWQEQPARMRRQRNPEMRNPGRLKHWVASKTVAEWITFGVVALSSLFVAVHLGLGNIFSSTTPAGGDMGAHVWGPAFMRDELLTSWRLTGWSPDWYAGLPAFHFYMVPPMLAIALLSYVLPYGMAFKLVAVSGVVTMPIAAWFFGRAARLPFPAPALMAVGTTVFLFDRSFSIFGGNLASTLAGEFAFSISLSLTLVYLGVVNAGLRTGRYRALGAVLFALVVLTHVIPAFFAVGATVVLLAVHTGAPDPWRRIARAAMVPGLVAIVIITVAGVVPRLSGSEGALLDGRVLVVLAAVAGTSAVVWLVCAPGLGRWLWAAGVGVVGTALSAWWILPFWMQRAYLNDMGWERKTNISTLLWDRGTTAAGRGLDSGLVDSPPMQWVIGVAVVGVVLSLVNRRRLGVALLIMAVGAALAVWGLPQGRLWNARVTPFYYLCLYLLAAIGAAEFGRLLSSLVARDVNRPVNVVQWATAVGVTVVVLGALALPLRSLPGGSVDDSGVYRWGPLSTTDSSFVTGWARWNFSGYESKEAWPEYRDVLATMAGVGEDFGCGRAMWEYSSDLDRYGTPMALMLLPYWTSGCIGSMEGLYFETSATTPYHFLVQDRLSQNPSNAQRGLPYSPGPPEADDFQQGIADLQLLGVRYYMASSELMHRFADESPDLMFITSSGPWRIYEVLGVELVESLNATPVIVEGSDVGGEVWLEFAADWFVEPTARDLLGAAGGPDTWPRVPIDDAVASITAGNNPWAPLIPESAVTVTNIDVGTDTLSFTVDQTGIPVLVKVSYFPNWGVDGADGPWRVTPNLMVVVPTDTRVTLTYGFSRPELAGWGLSWLGVIGVIGLWWWGRRTRFAAMWWLWPTRLQPDDSPTVPPSGGGVPLVPLSDPPPGVDTVDRGAGVEQGAASGNDLLDETPVIDADTGGDGWEYGTGEPT